MEKYLKNRISELEAKLRKSQKEEMESQFDPTSLKSRVATNVTMVLVFGICELESALKQLQP